MSESKDIKVRLDHKVILEMIEPHSKVLDLGCGNGVLLSLLMEHNFCTGAGIEIDEQAIYKCFERGVSVSQGNLDGGLDDYRDQCFDYVILNESVQEVLNPQKVILEALRVGKKLIVGIPNFGHIDGRLQIFFGGQVPVTKWLPYKWYNTPNLRFLTLKDFRQFCQDKKIVIEQERALSLTLEINVMTNLFAHVGLFLLKKEVRSKK